MSEFNDLPPGIYAITDEVMIGMEYCLTAHNHYKTVSSNSVSFTIMADDGQPISCRWRKCAFLGGKNWEKIIVSSGHGNVGNQNAAKSQTKNKMISVRVSEEALDRAESRSKRLGLKMADYITHLIFCD